MEAAPGSPLPASHLDLVDGPYAAILTTLMPDGRPQTTPVWCNREGNFVLINTMRDFQKAKNMRANPRVTLLLYDPAQPLRNLEIRGRVVEMSQDGAAEHLDRLTQLYLGRSDAHFFGDCVDAALRKRYAPVRVKIAPQRVRTEG